MPIKTTVNKIKQFIVHRILHIDDTPHRLALGVAVGFFVAWTPTIGLQSILAVLIALVLRANKVVGLPFVWISNPFTFFAIYWPNYLIGNAIMAIFLDRPRMHYRDFKELIVLFINSTKELFYSGKFSGFTDLVAQFMSFTVDLWVGSLVIGLILAVITYFLSYRLIYFYRNNTLEGRRFMKNLLKKKQRKKQMALGAESKNDNR